MPERNSPPSQSQPPNPIWFDELENHSSLSPTQATSQIFTLEMLQLPLMEFAYADFVTEPPDAQNSLTMFDTHSAPPLTTHPHEHSPSIAAVIRSPSLRIDTVPPPLTWLAGPECDVQAHIKLEPLSPKRNTTFHVALSPRRNTAFHDESEALRDQDISEQSPVGAAQSNTDQQSNTSIKSEKQTKKRVRKRASCDICGMGFSRSDHLRRHMSRHTGVREFECSVCGKSFARKDELLRHSRSH